MGGDVVSYSLDVLNEGKEIDSVNITNFVLIPKVPHPTNLGILGLSIYVMSCIKWWQKW